MYVVATFRYSKNIEMAVADLENMGLENKQLLVLPLDKSNSQTQFFDTIYKSDGQSYFDIGAILGMIFMLLGAIYGFVLKWGPILCALFGLVIGGILGFLIRFIYNKRTNPSKGKKESNETEVVLIVNCGDNEEDKVKQILWGHVALGVASYKNNQHIKKDIGS